jgi:hypothetical protein
MRVADVLADDAGAQAGDLRPLGEIHLRSRHSSPSAASNRSSPFGCSTDGNTDEQVVAQIGGRRALSMAVFIAEGDARDLMLRLCR